MKIIPLTQGKVALVDDEDYEKLIEYKWHTLNSKKLTPYAIRDENNNGHKQVIFMQNVIMGLPYNKPRNIMVDHKDGDSLNNQKNNLRVCDKGENTRNARKRKDGKSNYKGVFMHKASGKWSSGIQFNKKRYYLGLFSTELEAAEAYNKAAKLYHSEFAKLNVIQDGNRLPSQY